MEKKRENAGEIKMKKMEGRRKRKFYGIWRYRREGEKEKETKKKNKEGDKQTDRQTEIWIDRWRYTRIHYIYKQHTGLSTYSSINQSVNLSVYLSIYIHTYIYILSTYLSTYREREENIHTYKRKDKHNM